MLAHFDPLLLETGPAFTGSVFQCDICNLSMCITSWSQVADGTRFLNSFEDFWSANKLIFRPDDIRMSKWRSALALSKQVVHRCGQYGQPPPVSDALKQKYVRNMNMWVWTAFSCRNGGARKEQELWDSADEVRTGHSRRWDTPEQN
jgi:hypothetical protein